MNIIKFIPQKLALVILIALTLSNCKKEDNTTDDKDDDTKTDELAVYK